MNASYGHIWINGVLDTRKTHTWGTFPQIARGEDPKMIKSFGHAKFVKIIICGHVGWQVGMSF